MNKTGTDSAKKSKESCKSKQASKIPAWTNVTLRGGAKGDGSRSVPVKLQGQRGWHVMFSYPIEATGEPKGETPFAWHKSERLARTKHGTWEHDQVKVALEK